MKLFPVITAILVMIGLSIFVFQRDRLFEASGRAPIAEVADTTAETPLPAQDIRRVSVMAIDSVERPIDNAVILRGRTQALRHVDVMAETSGRVISEPLRKGAQVTAGQLMCELDPGTKAADLAEAEARLREARARVPEAESRVNEAISRVAEAESRLDEARINQNAAATLIADGFASTTRLANADAALSSAEASVSGAQSGVTAALAGVEAARAGIQSAEAAVLRATDALNDLRILAPFDGLLETDTAEFGAYLNTQGGGSHCATVIQLDPIKLVGFVPELDMGKVKPGANAAARLTDGREVFGQVKFLSRAADLTTRTFQVEILVPNADLSINDGQTVTIAIASDGDTAHLLPASALTLNDDGVLGVRHVIEGDTGAQAAFAAVTLLRDTNEGAWVTGLPETAKVIVVGQDFVTHGSPVRVTIRKDGV